MIAVSPEPLAVEVIPSRIHIIRGQKIILDRHLAQLYEVKAIALRQQVKRNKERFPEDFMFQLTAAEAKALVSQSVIPSSSFFGGRLPYAFTEQGVAMLSSVLTSTRAVQVNIAIMRTFVKLREIMTTHVDLAHKIESLEHKYDQHDGEIQSIFDAIRQLLEPPVSPKRPIGFRPEEN